ncbi:hypothetical protein [Mycobacteroides abscessus]|uniref:Uncharacterized protein n=1 Tax=Mycobacteroides abscessus subsp. abscessus TaxID=1185650 RepID=A0AB38D747_9MYCO|nr:hypothetical protein [Mycobacteroides abscessus]SIB99958.1 Uncharacterised protein [Mycobacteroides abscessus subsp. abscessus]SIC25606.1 Uncharacterised protein [Mycobacteroides abscessus subsp. abscessus]SIC25829.1 Uncharacterised protein [Mycobacteroides abscessus subsp. abscessus]SIC34050.1 Uncharacterised protein [Mycobacteroides abscessus subsp. abscessus]SKR84162.1 Uncharacterised protein [Mycobacteroides abscessus subsp. abscessus]
MAPQPDLQKPHDTYSLLGENWPSESESAYRTAEVAADDASTAAATQSQSATDAGTQMADESGQTADAVSGGYGSAAAQLNEQSRNFATISAWMTDAGSKVLGAKRHIRQLVRSGTQEIRDALDSELRGTPVTPSSSNLITQYRGEIAQSATQLTTDLDSIGHSLHGDPGASTTPTYVRASSTTPTVEHSVHQGITGESEAPKVTPKALPEMPRATPTPNTEAPNATGTPSAPAAPHPVNPTLANLIGGGQGSTSTGTPSAASPHASSPNTGASSTQSHQPTEQREAPRPAGLSRIPSLPLDGLPAAAAESVATVVSAAVGHQLSTTTNTTITPTVPVSTGTTPGVPGTPPMTSTPLTPIGGGGGLATPAVTQPVQPAPQAAPASPSPAPQQTTPSPTRSPVVDAAWLQRTYGLAPGIEAPKSETAFVPAIFIADLPEPEAHLHRALASLRLEFEQSGWAQPLAVATIRKGFESRTVYVTSDGVSIHPHGVLLSHGLTPLDEMPSAPVAPELAGSIMVSEKLKALIPYGWEVEGLVSTLPADEHHQSTEHYQELVEAGELLDCKGSRGRDDVEVGEAMRVFARAAIGSAGCSDLDVESSRLRGSRWVGVQPSGYQGLLARWYLSDAADSMSRGAWGEAVYSSEKYLGVMQPRSQAA